MGLNYRVRPFVYDPTLLSGMLLGMYSLHLQTLTIYPETPKIPLVMG